VIDTEAAVEKPISAARSTQRHADAAAGVDVELAGEVVFAEDGDFQLVART
jgi:hypothetical protein